MALELHKATATQLLLIKAAAAVCLWLAKHIGLICPHGKVHR